MKKLLSLLVLTVVVATGCKSQSGSAEAKKLAKSDVTYEYSAFTRGTRLHVVINNFGIGATKGHPGEKAPETFKTIAQNDRNALLEETSKLNLDKFETVEVPSKKHQFDGAMAANFKITVDGKTYQTPTFDHGNPPAEIKALVEKIIELSELEKE